MNANSKMFSSITEAESQLLLCSPTPQDGAAIYALIQQSPPLDVNSCYAYLLQGLHFSDTCVVAKNSDNSIVAYISAYILPNKPNKPNTLFVWQVAVSSANRGQRLATKMIAHLLQRPVCKPIQYIETTVSPSNVSSARLFQHLARQLNTQCTVSELFLPHLFGQGFHEAEEIFCIGPF